MEGDKGWREMAEESRHLTEDDRKLLGAVFESLGREQTRILEKIQQEVVKELSWRGPKNWNIVTALVDKADVRKFINKGFEEMAAIDSHREHMDFEELERTKDPGHVYCGGIGFLKCPYHQVREYTKRDYLAKVTTKDSEYQVSYRLCRSFIFLGEEEKVERTAAQYGVAVPPLYSPMSRRAVLVKVDLGYREAERGDQLKIDFQYEANGLEGIMMPEKTLVWNVSVKEKNQMPRPGENTDKTIVPRFHKECRIYRFDTKENEYIYGESQNADLRRICGDIYLGMDPEKDLDDLTYWKICLNPWDGEDYGEKAFYFPNRFRQGAVVKERIRTEADMEYVLNCFEGDDFRYAGCQNRLGDSRSVVTYDKKSAYHYPKNRHLRSGSFCYVRLEETDSIYFEDWVSYAMAYMNYFYPEFYWVGVV